MAWRSGGLAHFIPGKVRRAAFLFISDLGSCSFLSCSSTVHWPWPEAAAKLHATAIDKDAADKRRQTALGKLNGVLKRSYALQTLPEVPVDLWTDAEAIKLHTAWWEARIARQKEIDVSIARAADVEFLYDRPYVDSSRVRVAGSFTVESLSPHRVVTSRDDSLSNEIMAQQLSGRSEVASSDADPKCLHHSDGRATFFEAAKIVLRQH